MYRESPTALVRVARQNGSGNGSLWKWPLGGVLTRNSLWGDRETALGDRETLWREAETLWRKAETLWRKAENSSKKAKNALREDGEKMKKPVPRT